MDLTQKSKPFGHRFPDVVPEWFFVLALPFALFYWMIPFVGSRTLGTDYVDYHIYHHLALMFSIKTGAFPLYAPFCFYGQSSAYLLAEIYHPVVYLAAAMPGYWNGLSLEWLTLFRLVSLAACHFSLLGYLKIIGLNRVTALLLSLVTVYNMKTLELFWHINALEAWTGFLFLCASVGRYHLRPQGWLLPGAIVFALYWLITSGIPPMVYYALIGGLLFTLTTPFFHASLRNEQPQTKQVLGFWARIGGLYALGMLSAANYLSPFVWDYMRLSSGRVDQSYAWSAQWCDTFTGFLNNFFQPLASGFGMFGGSPLFLAAILTPFVLRLLKVRIPMVIWAVSGIMLLLFAYMQGERTPLHYWAWKYLPFTSAVRGPSRISIMLPVLFMMLLAWLFHQPALILKARKWRPQIRPLAISALCALIFTVLYAGLPEGLVQNSHYSCPSNIRDIPIWVKPAVLLTSLALLAILAAGSWRSPEKPEGIPAVALLTVFQLLVLFRYGPYAVQDKTPMPSFERILSEKRQAIDAQPAYFLNQHSGSRTVMEQLKNYFMEPNLGTVYRKHIPSSGLSETYDLLNHSRTAEEVVVEGYSPSPPEKLTDDGCGTAGDRVELTYSAYNRMVFSVTACRSSFFVFSYPFSDLWKATVNGRPVPIYRANGAAQAVRLQAGQSSVEFRYESRAALAGMVASCTVFALLGIMIGRRHIPKPAGYGVTAGAPFLAAVVFWLWYASLYGGENLNTVYFWQSPPPDAPRNLAFGRTTAMSSHRQGYPYLYNSRHAVDGGRTAASCFFTDRENNPWWMVDLGEPAPVASVVVYTSFCKEGFNTPPLMLSISEDGTRWRNAPVISLCRPGEATSIVIRPVETARYVRIQASGECVLTFNEVEVYPE